MVFAGEGLRSPRLPARVNNSPQPLTGRAVSGALIGAAAAAAVAGSAAMPGTPVQSLPANSIVPQAAPTRTAPVPSASAVNPLLSGAGGSRAPSIMPPAGRTLSPTRAPLPRAGGGGGAAASLASAGIPLLTAAAGKALSGGNPLDVLRGDPLSNPFSPESRAAEDQMSRDAAARRQAVGDAFNSLGDAAKSLLDNNYRQKSERKGDTFNNPYGKGTPVQPKGTQLGKAYILTVYTDNGYGSKGNSQTTAIGPIGGMTISRYDLNGKPHIDASITTGNGVLSIMVAGEVEKGATASLVSVVPVDGVPDPPVPADPNDFKQGNGMSLPAQLGNVPLLPNTGQARPSAAGKPSTGTQPNQSRPAPPRLATPGQPSTGSPVLPNATQPSRPDRPGLPNIPAAPSTGSASPSQPAFPSAFNAAPASRNANAMQPLQPSAPNQPQPRPCADPCIRTVQNQQAEQGNALEGLGELLKNLLQGQEEQAEEQEKQRELSLLPVPIVSCKSDGYISTTMVNIEVPKSLEKAVLEQFKALAALQSDLCRAEYFSHRAHNILGGDSWFKEPSSRLPQKSSKIERDLKRFGEALGFPKLPPENPLVVKQEEELEKRTQKPTPGKVTVFGIPDMIQAYSSLLFHRAGLHEFPAELPKTLLGYSDGDKPEILKDFASYFHWYVKQFDALIGKFPIEITIEDADPAKPGKQTKILELPNISEALAEMYGLSINTGTNTDLSVNMLARIAVETVAAKNAALIAQDYSKGNASFLGYKGNTVKRDIKYAFNPTKFDTLDEFLATTTAQIEGWQEEDPETVVGFLQRIMFSAGIIKAVFHRDKDLIKQFEKEAASLLEKDKDLDDAKWLQFIQMINNADSKFNAGDNPQPKADKEPDSGTSPKK